MEELREKLYKFIEQYGLLDPKTVQVSQALDVLIVKSIKKEMA